jgi:hypothetical protein
MLAIRDNEEDIDDQIEISPITRSKQLPPNNLWRLTPYKCFGILLEDMLLLVSSSKYQISAQFYAKQL